MPILENPTDESVKELLNCLESYREPVYGRYGEVIGFLPGLRFRDFSERFDPWNTQRLLTILDMAS